MDQSAKNVGQRLWCSRGMIVTVCGPGDAQVSVHVPRPFARIGSDRYAEVSLPQGDLLPCNLYLHATANGIYCLGLSESAPNGWLTPHTRAEIGPYRIKAVFDDEGAPPLAGDADPRKKGASPGPAPLLSIRERNGKRNPVELAVDRPLTVIGRRSPSVFRMAHRTVSRVHCVLYWNGRSLWAIDLLSANRTLLAQAPIEAAPWNAGQKLSLGDFRIRYLGLNDQAPTPRLSQKAAPENESAPSQSTRPRPRRRLPKWRQAVSGSPGQNAPIPKALAEEQASAEELAESPGHGKGAKVESEGRNHFPLSMAFPPRSAGEPSPTSSVPTAVDRGEGSIASREQGSLAPKGLVSPTNVDSGEETTESERQLLHALRMLAASATGSDCGDGELPPQLFQALLAMVQQALSQANRAEESPGEIAGLLRAEQQLAIEADRPGAPARLLEQELTMVSLTLVKARQIAETSLAPAKADIDRLIDAMRGLEGRLAQLVDASRDQRFPAIESPEQLGSDGPTTAALIERRSSEIYNLAERAPNYGQTVLHPRLALTTMQPADAAEQTEPRITAAEPAAKEDHSSIAGASSRVSVAARAAGHAEVPEQAAGEFEPEAPAKDARAAGRIAGSQPAGMPEPLMDDEMLSRLVNFKAKQDDVIRRRKVVWTATAAVAFFLVVAATGAAKFFLSGPKSDVRAGEYSSQDYAKITQ
ncbi:MAG TPA: FHA domain-containing protein [Pirellulales bacterium]|nr:FHA domain-containing protein [Pirellulales bacterium]